MIFFALSVVFFLTLSSLFFISAMFLFVCYRRICCKRRALFLKALTLRISLWSVVFVFIFVKTFTHAERIWFSLAVSVLTVIIEAVTSVLTVVASIFTSVITSVFKSAFSLLILWSFASVISFRTIVSFTVYWSFFRILCSICRHNFFFTCRLHFFPV